MKPDYKNWVPKSMVVWLFVGTAADRIVVLSDGRVVEEGRPEARLADEESVFRRMTKLQAASANWSL